MWVEGASFFSSGDGLRFGPGFWGFGGWMMWEIWNIFVDWSLKLSLNPVNLRLLIKLVQSFVKHVKPSENRPWDRPKGEVSRHRKHFTGLEHSRLEQAKGPRHVRPHQITCLVRTGPAAPRVVAVQQTHADRPIDRSAGHGRQHERDSWCKFCVGRLLGPG